jgi:poly(A) polymerase/tRNA nucleotidyltransferase (CCA-adding enzyme)
MKTKIPREIENIAEKLKNVNFQAYLVGGCVRDLSMNRAPKDWDIATDARPEEIQKLFPDSAYENKFGTVAVKATCGTNAEQTRKRAEKFPRESASGQRESAPDIVEVTTFRLEGKYTDKRHPDEIKFAKTIEEDLSRRDFTINAMAISLSTKHEARISKQIQNVDKIQNSKSLEFSDLNLDIVSDFGFRISDFILIDPFNGQNDIKNKIIRTVGNPIERFNEDALRLMRAIRFAVELGFSIEEETAQAIKQEAGLLEMIAKERIRDEFQKILMTENAASGVQMLEDLNLLKYIVPELREGIGIGQNKHHIYTVWEHNLRALDYSAKKNYPPEIRMAALFHDIGKPRTKRGEGPDCTFYGHEILSAKMTARILDRLHFPKNMAEKIIHLVRYHLFYYNVGEVTEAGVRRFLRRVGPEYVEDFIKVREADRIGSGVPKAVPYKLRHLLFMIEKVKRDPLSPKMLAVNGEDVMKILNISPGPRVGRILAILLDEVIEEPAKNRIKDLELRIKELGELLDAELEKLAKEALEKKEEFESGIEEEMKKRYYVK